uniref:Uncharacterized protein LOC104216144 n=1 Tax=Nicotiana sylvestris TaxID=4096 RepID=A0A1U7VRC9_NICSY
LQSVESVFGDLFDIPIYFVFGFLDSLDVLFYPDEIKKKVEVKFDEIGERVEKGEITPEEGYALFKEFEDGVVVERAKLMEKDAPQFDENMLPDKNKNLDDPPGEGPVLRWQTRVVFAPGGDAWHPKNRKVKLAVTVKELGLSKHQFGRLRELVGNRYHPGRDELTITSESYPTDNAGTLMGTGYDFHNEFDS